MDAGYDTDRLDALVGRIFSIQGKTYGDPKTNTIVRYVGRLLSDDSAAAYDQLAESLLPIGITPLFRIENNQHVIRLIPGLPKPKPSNPRVNLVLFLLTLISVWVTGGMFALTEQPANTRELLWTLFTGGWPFALSMLGILGAHEFGHYLAGRYHKVHVTLPYFIPLPLVGFGTMGAVIQMKEIPKNRRILHDIGLAGPLAGLIVGIPVLLIGLSLSQLVALPAAPGLETGLSLEGNSILYLMLKYATFGKLLPQPVDFHGLPPLLYWLQYLFTGHPLPYGGLDVNLHMVAWAGWGGLLVTSFNLIPAGQLDGGHLLYVLVGERRARRILPFILVALIGLGVLYPGWFLWAALIFFLFSRGSAEPLDTITPLDPVRRWTALLGIILFFLLFVPIPLTIAP
jgi:membrane-associated protease RseP (regulator of RpoE activity)